MNENEIGTIIVNTAVDLHKKLGPGLLESVYEIDRHKSRVHIKLRGRGNERRHLQDN